VDHRIEKIEALIQDILAEMIARDFSVSRETLITITKVKASGNLQEAKVYVSVLPDRERTKIVASMERNAWVFQSALNKKLRMRPVPKIIFMPDANPAQAQQVETILEQLKQSGKD
jgi:ribosome-binding factor A